MLAQFFNKRNSMTYRLRVLKKGTTNTRFIVFAYGDVIKVITIYNLNDSRKLPVKVRKILTKLINLWRKTHNGLSYLSQ
jgi:hypothetical protein